MADTYKPKDVAALLVLFFRTATAEAGEYKSFAEQVEGAKKISSNQEYLSALAAIEKLQGERPHVIEAAHFALKAVLDELKATNAWGVCKFVNPDHIRRILNF